MARKSNVARVADVYLPPPIGDNFSPGGNDRRQLGRFQNHYSASDDRKFSREYCDIKIEIHSLRWTLWFIFIIIVCCKICLAGMLAKGFGWL
ncbi:MAG: hypothetical protein H7833_13505 [Magnetococcus sp. DMHC-1]|nr:hypothetical protein [Magnetococcales bacterium]